MCPVTSSKQQGSPSKDSQLSKGEPSGRASSVAMSSIVTAEQTSVENAGVRDSGVLQHNGDFTTGTRVVVLGMLRKEYYKFETSLFNSVKHLSQNKEGSKHKSSNNKTG